MKLTPLLYKAIHEAARLHEGQRRKIVDVPFVVHPFAVGMLLARYTDDEEVIAAGLLHDTLEDVEGYEYAELKDSFGERVADIVLGVTEEAHGSWREVRRLYIAALRSGGEEAVMVAAADKVHNLLSTIEGVERFGEGVWEKFHGEPADYEWFYGEVLAVAKERLDSPIVQELEEVLARARETIF